MQQQQTKGFTLLEVMLVLLLMGLVVGTVVVNAVSSNPEDKLEKQARRLQVIVDMASDFAVINQQQLGLRVNLKEREYLFMRLDEEQQWQPFDVQAMFEAHQLPEDFALELALDNLPWQEDDSLFDKDLFEDELSVSEQGVNIGEEEPPPPPPQILLLSSGEITPFSLTFKYEPRFNANDPVYFRVNAIDYAPLEFEGPLDTL